VVWHVPYLPRVVQPGMRAVLASIATCALFLITTHCSVIFFSRDSQFEVVPVSRVYRVVARKFG